MSVFRLLLLSAVVMALPSAQSESDEEADDSDLFTPHKAPGYCTPWGNTGDLCKDYKDSPSCTTAQPNYYLDASCNDECAQLLCVMDSKCKGYTKTLAKGWIKLKSQISSTSKTSAHICMLKSDNAQDVELFKRKLLSQSSQARYQACVVSSWNTARNAASWSWTSQEYMLDLNTIERGCKIAVLEGEGSHTQAQTDYTPSGDVSRRAIVRVVSKIVQVPVVIGGQLIMNVKVFYIGSKSTTCFAGLYEGETTFTAQSQSGYCKPTGSSGDLCVAMPKSAVCAGAKHGYLDTSCDEACAKDRCSKDTDCVGYTVNKRARRRGIAYKLKSSVSSGVHGSSSYRCVHKTSSSGSLKCGVRKQCVVYKVSYNDEDCIDPSDCGWIDDKLPAPFHNSLMPFGEAFCQSL